MPKRQRIGMIKPSLPLHLNEIVLEELNFISKRGILKTPPANPRTYIYRHYNKDPKRAINMFENMFEKALKLEKRLTMVYA